MRVLGQALLLLAGALLREHGVSALTAAEWRKQSIYQVVTDRFARTDLSTTAQCNPTDQVYCGGTWQGLISKLDYIKGMGFTAVWISPVVKQIDGYGQDGSAYHGYWAQNIWAVNPAFGTEADLVQLSAALHARGMYLMVDIVTNHMAYMGCGTCVDYSQFNPFSSSSYFHPYCTIDYNSQTSIQVCWQGSNTVSLPDLRTEDDSVRGIWNDWVRQMVSKYSIDGLRIDSAKHVEQSFWPGFSAAAGVYLVGEVFNGDPLYVTPYQQYMDGLLDYPSYYWILRAFQSSSGSISDLVSGLNTMRGAARDLSLYGSFLENHDVARFPSFTQDSALAKNAIAFTMLKDGIPIIYQGQEQHYAGGATPNNREVLWSSGYSTSSEFYMWITKLNQIRTRAIAQDDGYISSISYPIYSDGHTIATRKGASGSQIVGVFTNVGASSSASASLPSSATGFEANQALIDVMSCTAYTTDSAGGLTVTLVNGLPRVFYPKARLSNSGICSALTNVATTTAPTGASSIPTTSSATAACTAITITLTTTTTTMAGSTTTTRPSSTTTLGSITTTASTTATSMTSTTSSAAVSTSTGASNTCTLPTVGITFNELVTTTWGDVIKITGSVAALGNWSPSNGLNLSASQYTQTNPLWSGTVQLTPGTVIQYKFVKVSGSGTVSWEADPNRAYTVPCAAATVSSSWR